MKRAWLVLLLAACDPVDEVVVHVPDGGMFSPHPCTDSSDCHPNEFCAKEHGCGDLHGDCRLKPFCVDMVEYHPVCGCNGVTYWNDCWRAADGQAASTDGQCTAAKVCTDSSECSPSPTAACARVAALSCPASGSTGACWVMPRVCPSGQATNVQACSGGACMDLCGAIKSEQPALLKASCP